MVSVANSTTRDRHEDLLSSSECAAMAEREAKRRRVEWPGRVEPSEGEERVAVGVRDAGGELISMDALEDESRHAKLRSQVGLGGGDQQTQVRAGDDSGLFDESGPSSLDEVALARQVRTRSLSPLLRNASAALPVLMIRCLRAACRTKP